MEYVKKEILQAVTTGLTATTGGYKYIIIPDLSAVYHMKINLTQNTRDEGFFDAYVTGETITIVEGETEGGGSGIIPIPPEPELATVITGTWVSGNTLFSFINNNTISSDGNSPVTQYGVLFTVDESYKTAANLTYDNHLAQPTLVKRSSITSTPTTYSFNYSRRITISSELGDTLYYRAFVINGVGVAYGLVKSVFIPSGGGLIPLP